MLYIVIHLKLSLCAINLVQQFNSESKTSKSIVQPSLLLSNFVLLTVPIDSAKLWKVHCKLHMSLNYNSIEITPSLRRTLGSV